MRRGSVVRAVALGLPFVATGCVLALLLGPGRERSIPSTRAYVTGAAPWRAARLEAVTERAEVRAPLRVALEISRDAGPTMTVWTSERGTVDVTFDPPLGPGEALRVREGERVLLDAPLEEGEPIEAFVGERWSFSSASGAAPSLDVKARLRRGVVAPPFKATLEVKTSRGGKPVDAEVSFTLVSGEPDKGRVRSGPEGIATIELEPLAVPMKLSLEVAEDGQTARRSGDLSAQMGAIVPTLDGSGLTFTSPSPRSVAYYSVFDGRGRTSGGEVALAADPDGFFRGRANDLDLGSDAVVVVTPHALEDIALAYVWRDRDDLSFCGRESTARACVPAPQLLRLAADGGPVNRETERARVAVVRRGTTLLLSAALAIEIALVLLLARSRRSSPDRALRVAEDGLPEPSPTDDPEYAIRETSPWSQPAFVVVLALVAVMFALWAWLMMP